MARRSRCNTVRQPAAAYTCRVEARQPGLMDRCITEFDAALRTVAAAGSPDEPATPAAARAGPEPLTASERDLSARLMRVNHSGEIAAQALYRGQALVTRDQALRSALLRAADEEHEHLVWCRERTTALGAGISRLTPFWYAGALAIGMAAGLAGDRRSLGFLAETERQVTGHLDGHLARLPGQDQTSRRIVERMRADEQAHRQEALDRGGVEPPAPVRLAMRLASRVMTTVAWYF